MTLLPWVLGELRQAGLSDGAHAEGYTADQLLQVLRRMEFVVLAASRYGATEDAGPLTGILGTDLFAAELNVLQTAGKVAVPNDRGGASLGTYAVPCSSFGLLILADEQHAIQVPPRGQDVYKARKNALGSSKLTRLILEGGVLTKRDIAAEGRHFSVNTLKSSGAEQELLQHALLRPFEDDEALKKTYDRFRETSRWAFSNLGKARWSSELILIAYRAAIQDRKPLPPVQCAWAEYEFRRRMHFAIELLLSSLTDALIEMNGATLEAVSRTWARRGVLADYVEDATAWDRDCMSTKLSALDDSISRSAFTDEEISVSEVRALTHRSRAAYAVALMLATRAQTKKLRNERVFQSLNSPLETALGLLDRMRDESLAAVIRKLLSDVVAPAHLSTTLRKMSQGQKCSLRFYPEGPTLRPTGKLVNPGYSGDRLGNVLNFWTDLGVLERPDRGAPVLSAQGRVFVRAL